MGWRARRRDSIMQALAESASLAVIGTPESFSLECRSVRVGRSDFALGPDALVARSEAIRIATAATSHDASLAAAAESPVLTLCVTGGVVAPVGDDQIPVFPVDLGFAAPVTQVFTFGPVRRDRPSSHARKAPPGIPRRLGPTPPVPPPPPGLKNASIEEQLRWILTPPLNELLSDPQLTLPAIPYPYQQGGIKWLMDRRNALLADEMGLGKTMQALIAARLLWRQRSIEQILIVCPKTLISTWCDEIRRWWPDAIVHTKIIDERPEWYLRLGTDNIVIKIINYERLSRLVEWLREARFSHDLIIIDEAQRIKNAASKAAQAVKLLAGKSRWALTGTPLENRVSDLVSVFGFVHKGLLENDDVDHVKARIKGYMLRRRADEVLTDLPEKDEHDVRVDLTSAQREAYDRAEEEGVIRLNEEGDEVTVQHVFALIQKLMQLCNFEPVAGESAKLDRIAEDLEEIVESGRKALVFSQFVSPPYGIKQVAIRLPQVLGSAIPLGILQLHGEVRDRDSVRREFEADASKHLLLLNYKVGGVGLNLQCANYVYLFDRWWNPAVEDQAVKRVHRIGQRNKVFIRRLFCHGTIEERILQRLQEKRRLFAHMIDDDRPTPAMMGLSEEEVFGLFKNLRVRPKRRERGGGKRQLVLDNLSPEEFETLVGHVYEPQGFKVEYRGGPHDGGVDLEVERRDEMYTQRLAVQCKHISRPVGPDVVRELLGVLAREPRFNGGHIVCKGGFTAGAQAAASGHRIELIDGAKLTELAKRYGVADLV